MMCEWNPWGGGAFYGVSFDDGLLSVCGLPVVRKIRVYEGKRCFTCSIAR